ncbi:SMI1/KNR4 family protein [Luteimonas salinilitoris]|uniref:SMI1/KNR4 family protein n=1 Tax=Luteimonas salinilitoris TaxID=3237697 RepID=A0ABV4HTK1_9GAMM
MTIIQAVERLPYEKDSYAPFRYELEVIERLENLLGGPLPDDFRWYLANVGWRKIEYRKGSLLVPFGEYLQVLAFEAAENQVFAVSGYNDFVRGREGTRLPGEPREYFPFGQIKGGNPHVSLRLLVRLSDEGRGSIWAAHTVAHCDKDEVPEPLRLADDLAGFLSHLDPDRELAPIAERSNNALFNRLLENQLTSQGIEPTTAADPESLLAAFFKTPQTFVFDGARNVEYQYRFYGHGIANAAIFSQKAGWFSRPGDNRSGLFPAPLQRSEIVFGAPRVFDFPLVGSEGKNGFRLLTAESRVGDGFQLTEHFLAHEDEGRWTLVRRHDATIDDVRIKGVGTFTFDATYKWKLKKKVTPAWSELPAELRVEGEEDALNSMRIAFIKEVMARREFKQVFEARGFQIYTGRMYPEFEAMTNDEKEEWADCYPRLARSDEIWQLLGKKLTVTVLSDADFHIHTDAKWDPEHGLTVEVKAWQIAQAI